MKKIIAAVAALALSIVAFAQTNISKTEKANPGDDVFIDMAVTAGAQSKASGNKPCGAVIILNGAWKATGTPTATATAEEVAISKSRLKTLKGARVFTVFEPTTRALEALTAAEADAVYYAVTSDDAIEAGVYTADDYKPSESAKIPAIWIDYIPAHDLLQ